MPKISKPKKIEGVVAKKRANGIVYQCKVRTGTFDGQPQYTYFTASTPEEALSKKLLYEAKKPGKVDSKTTLSEFIRDSFIPEQKLRVQNNGIGGLITEKYQSEQEVRLRSYISDRPRTHKVDIGSMVISEITSESIVSFLSEYQKLGKSNHIVHRLKLDFSSIFELAVTLGKVNSNPVAAGLKKKFVAPKGNRTIWTWEEATAFLEYIKTSHYHGLLRTAIISGARAGELFALDWSDVDFKNGCIVIEKALELTSAGWSVRAYPKTETSRRSIALDKATLEALQATKKAQAGSGFGSAVFVGVEGHRLNKDNFHRPFARLMKAAKVRPIQFKELRHAMNSYMLKNGTPVTVVQHRMGHATSHMTLNNYRHLLAGEDRTAVDSLEQALKLNPAGGYLVAGASQEETA